MNPYTHFYLYAKGHYVKSDLGWDLAVIVGRYSHIDPKLVSFGDVRILLTDAVVSEMKFGNLEYVFPKFIKEIIGNGSADWHDILNALLGVLMLAPVEGRNLGEADPNILPLTKER